MILLGVSEMDSTQIEKASPFYEDEDPELLALGQPRVERQQVLRLASGVLHILHAAGSPVRVVVPAPPKQSVDRKGDRIKRNVWRCRYMTVCEV